MIIFTFLDLISRVMIGYDRNSIYASILKYFPVAIWHRMDFRGKSGIWDLGLRLCIGFHGRDFGIRGRHRHP